MSVNKQVLIWMEYASNDLLVAKELEFEKHFVYRAILTHSQQSVEKYLKAYLLYKKKEIIKTHDLLILNKLCTMLNENFREFEEEVNWLSINYIQSRYPDNFEDIDKEDAVKALNVASRFEQFILSKFDFNK